LTVDGVLNRRFFVTSFGGLAAACSRGRRRRIAVIPKSATHVFWFAVHGGVEAAAKEFAIDIVWKGPPTETDIEDQIRIVDEMIAQRVDAIALAAGHRTALVPAVDRAVAAGIPVTVFDSGLDSTSYVSYVATENVEAGKSAARKLAELMGGKGEVAVVMHAPGSASTMDREAGFSQTIKREFPAIRVVASEFGMSDPVKAQAATDRILEAHPGVNGLFASAEPSSVGAAQAIKARGLQDKVFLMAFDCSRPMLDDLRNGVVDATILQDPHRMGYEAVRTLVVKLDGGNPPKRLDLYPALVEKKDLEEPNVKRLLSLTT
jgi:ribose transport system substrate-binding protein